VKIKLKRASVSDMKQGSMKKVDQRIEYNDAVRIFLEEMKLFSIKDKKIIYMITRSFDDLKKLPEPGEQFRIRVQQSMNLIVLLLCILKKNKTIDELSVVTYSLNKKAFNIMIDLATSGRIKKINILLSSSNRFRSAKHLEYLINGAKILFENNFPIAFVLAWTHSKITLARCGSDYYQFEGSMNYSMNNMAEQLILENNKELYDFDYEFISKTMQDTNNKALEIII